MGLPVPGEGSPNAKVVFIGEAPGKTEAKTGKPFVGSAGRVLRNFIAEASLKEGDIFITSPVHYLPKHGTPTSKEIEHGRLHTYKQIQVIKPKIVVLMGRIACLAMLNRTCQISKEHGKIVKYEVNSPRFSEKSRRVNTYFITYHPAAMLYSNRLKSDLKKDFAKLKRILNK